MSIRPLWIIAALAWAGLASAQTDQDLDARSAEDAGLDSDVVSEYPPDQEPEPLATIELPRKDAEDGSAQADATPRPKSRLVEEIVVTAQKREQNLQDVPISVQAFSAELLDARGITNQNDLMQVTPGLDIGTQVSFTTVYMRGVGTDAYLTADPSVATYIDGIYFPFTQGLAQDFGVIERIEVLKGPQGTLFGRNATGGALNIITKDPELDQFSGGAQVTVANYPDFHTKASVNLPIGDTLAVGLSGVYSTTEYYVKGTADGRPLDDDREGGVRLKVRWAPNEYMDGTLSYFYLDSAKPGTKFALNRYSTDLLVLLGQPRVPNEPYFGRLDARTDDALENEVFYGTLKFFTPWFDIKLLGSDQFINTQGLFDFDGTTTALVSFVPENQFADIRTGEVQFISNDWSPDWLEWIGGLYYFDGVSGFAPIFGKINAAELANDTLSAILDPIGDLLGFQPDQVELEFYATVATQSEAAYSQMTFTLTNWMDLTLGLRYQKETRKIDRSETFITTPIGLNVPFLSVENTPPRDQRGNVVPATDVTETLSPKVSLEFRPLEDDTLVYLSYQEATKSATYNVTLVTGGPTYAYPEKIHAWELGAKKRFFDGLLSLSSAAFVYDIDDLQVQFLALTSGGVVNFENAEEAKIRGMDFDFTAQLFPSVFDDLVLVGGGAWLKDADYARFPNARGFMGNTGLVSQNNDFSGNRIVRTPKYTANLSLSKTWPIVGGPLEVTIDYYYNDGFNYETSSDPRSFQDSYINLGARVSWLYERWNLRTTVFGKNLTDEIYSQGQFTTDFGLEPTIAPPLTYGMRLSWDF